MDVDLVKKNANNFMRKVYSGPNPKTETLEEKSARQQRELRDSRNAAMRNAVAKVRAYQEAEQ